MKEDIRKDFRSNYLDIAFCITALPCLVLPCFGYVEFYIHYHFRFRFWLIVNFS